MLTCV
jgi:hypothetical protein